MSSLKEYLIQHSLKPTPWAIKNGLSPATISRHLKGKKINIDNVLKIQRATNDEVTLKDICK